MLSHMCWNTYSEMHNVPTPIKKFHTQVIITNFWICLSLVSVEHYITVTSNVIELCGGNQQIVPCPMKY